MSTTKLAFFTREDHCLLKRRRVLWTQAFWSHNLSVGALFSVKIYLENLLCHFIYMCLFYCWPKHSYCTCVECFMWADLKMWLDWRFYVLVNVVLKTFFFSQVSIDIMHVTLKIQDQQKKWTLWRKEQRKLTATFRNLSIAFKAA